MSASVRDANDGAAAKRGKGRILALAGAGIVVLAGGGGAAAFALGLVGGADAPAAQEGRPEPDSPAGQVDAHGAPEDAAPSVFFVDLPDLLVNLQSDGKRGRFLRLRIALEVGSDKAGEAVKALTPRVLDSFQMYLRALTPADLEGAAGLQRLKEEMVARANLAVEPSRIRDVLVKEMLVQ